MNNRLPMPYRRSTVLSVLALCLISLSATGCEGPTSAPGELETCKMAIGTKTYELEMARTEAQQEKGLMKRDSMADDHGMIFIFPAEKQQDFWMKDTRFALDIIFVDHAGVVVSVSTMKPYDLNNTPSEGPAQYAIELNANQAKAAGIEKGKTLKIPDVAIYKAK